MDETENFVKYIKDNFEENEIKMAYSVYITKLLSYNMITEKIKEKEQMVEKPTNVLDLYYLKLCAKRFTDSENLLEKIFLYYSTYSIREYRNIWKLNLNNVDADLNMKCSYCNIKTKRCPFKLFAYIKKCISDNNFNENKVFDMLIDKRLKKIQKI